ncbi:MAG: polysaccharide biosynthesis/export family protein [Micropepsaceae bacterium]
MTHIEFSAARTLTLLAFSLSLSACADQMVSVRAADPSERSLTAERLSAAAYRLAAGDRVRVTVFDLAAESSEHTIDDTGAIAVPAIQPVAIKGGTTKEAAEAIANAFGKAGLYRNARVSVDILTYGPFYMLGEVAKPGEFGYRPGLSLFAAVAMAGGHTYRANKGRVYIRRATDPVETEYDLESDIAIMPGDVVRIPELQL